VSHEASPHVCTQPYRVPKIAATLDRSLAYVRDIIHCYTSTTLRLRYHATFTTLYKSHCSLITICRSFAVTLTLDESIDEINS
jgi:hypothetical protein